MSFHYCFLFLRSDIYQLWVSPLNYRLFIGVQLSDRNWFILWSNSLLVESVEQAPIADVLTWFRVGGLLGLEVISGEINEFFGLIPSGNAGIILPLR
jgi:hypothetical protein